ncbi:RNase A-like domain-containing protein [Streptomyces phyllanthi]|uniref:Bacterial CdiA-CT RNAse A domain-containing protein n=1 Tax=Streptomyces phyllanthi TaxID=1803180 RepID=A0A5N8W6Q2_9ACTN|nr:RNase A-like domain-containing protein [Streptomyces phyllanthi]MPY42576.1 hypothetical protein [Streptomyces phyllanthi]
MNTFCQSIWGTTAWGRRWKPDGGFLKTTEPGGRDWRTNPSVAPAARRPLIDVLKKTGDDMKQAFHDVADAADKCRETTQRLALEATKATIRDLVPDSFSLDEFTKMAAVLTFAEVVLLFRTHMDKSGADRAVETCHKAFHEGATKLRALIPELTEASRSAPTYEAEEARAEAFGARSLNEFKPEHKWSTPGDADRGVYKVDLASTEWLENSHTVLKHVGLTDDQLAQRLRDDLKKEPRPESSWPNGQPQVARASTFTDLQSAQNLTQYNLDKNSVEIKEWLDGPPKDGARKDFSVENTPYGISGRSIGKSEMKSDDFPSSKAQDVTGVETRLVYNGDLDPPFTVLTSMPIESKKED